MASEHVKKYLDRIESQHQTSPKYMAHVETLLDLIDGVYLAIKEAPGKFDLATASGHQLDIIGGRVGAPRKVNIPGSAYYGQELDDDSYRMYISSRIFRNHWDGTSETFKEVWDNTLGNFVDADYYDNQDMTVTIALHGRVPDLITSMILAGEILPRPMGVTYNIAFDNASNIVVSGDSDYFEIVYMYAAGDTYNGQPYDGVEYCGANDLEDWEEYDPTQGPARTDSAIVDVSYTG